MFAYSNGCRPPSHGTKKKSTAAYATRLGLLGLELASDSSQNGSVTIARSVSAFSLSSYVPAFAFLTPRELLVYHRVCTDRAICRPDQTERCPTGDDPRTTTDETDCWNVTAPGGFGVGAEGNVCQVDCSNRGLCDFSTGTCTCFKGYHGQACETYAVNTDN